MASGRFQRDRLSDTPGSGSLPVAVVRLAATGTDTADWRGTRGGPGSIAAYRPQVRQPAGAAPAAPKRRGGATGPAITAAVLLLLLAAGATLLVLVEPGRRLADGDVRVSDVDRIGSGTASDAFPLIAIEPSQFDGLQGPKAPARQRDERTGGMSAAVPLARTADPDATLLALPVAAGRSAEAPNAATADPAGNGSAAAAGVLIPIPPPGSEAPGIAARSGAGQPSAPGAAMSPNPGALDPMLLMDRGDAFLDRSDVSSARLFFQLAAEQGSAAGALAMAATYDPLKRTGTDTGSARPDPRAAVEWYRRAAKLGARDADAQIARLVDAMSRRAASGDAEARAALTAIGR